MTNVPFAYFAIHLPSVFIFLIKTFTLSVEYNSLTKIHEPMNTNLFVPFVCIVGSSPKLHDMVKKACIKI